MGMDLTPPSNRGLNLGRVSRLLHRVFKRVFTATWATVDVATDEQVVLGSTPTKLSAGSGDKSIEAAADRTYTEGGDSVIDKVLARLVHFHRSGSTGIPRSNAGYFRATFSRAAAETSREVMLCKAASVASTHSSYALLAKAGTTMTPGADDTLMSGPLVTLLDGRAIGAADEPALIYGLTPTDAYVGLVLTKAAAGYVGWTAIKAGGDVDVLGATYARQGVYDLNGVKVLDLQQSAIAAPSGVSIDQDAEARTAIGSILTALRAHGIIAT